MIYTPTSSRRASAIRTLFLCMRRKCGAAQACTSGLRDSIRTAHWLTIQRNSRLPRLVNRP